MTESRLLDPYAGNILVERLNPLVSREEAMVGLRERPEIPPGIEDAPPHIRQHYLMRVRSLHIPTLVEGRLWTTMDLMVRSFYGENDPAFASTWSVISGEKQKARKSSDSLFAAALGGPSGTGKTQAAHRCMKHCLGSQVIPHTSFPGVLNETMLQLVWLSVDVPPSGKAKDLARALMQKSKDVTGTDRFDSWLVKEDIRDGQKALMEWEQWAVAHFLGLLHLDEVQNFFKLQSLKQRKNRQGPAGEPELSLQEDAALKWLVNVANGGRFGVLVGGTMDGIAALTRRFSTASRIFDLGFHAFEPYKSGSDPALIKVLLPELAKYQLVKVKLPLTVAQLGDLVYDLTSGVHRIIIGLWIAAHRIVFERKKDELTEKDFKLAAATLLAPLSDAINALKSNDPNRLRNYEDLVVKEGGAVWRNLYGEALTEEET